MKNKERKGGELGPLFNIDAASKIWNSIYDHVYDKIAEDVDGTIKTDVENFIWLTIGDGIHRGIHHDIL